MSDTLIKSVTTIQIEDNAAFKYYNLPEENEDTQNTCRKKTNLESYLIFGLIYLKIILYILKKKLDGEYERMLRAIFNKF